MKQQVFSFKKGQLVPYWVHYITATLDGLLYSGKVSLEFLSNGKIFVTKNGDIVCYPLRPRNKRSCLMVLIHKGDDLIDVNVNGAGDGDVNMFNFRTKCSLAIKEFKLKNTVKTYPLPMMDPRK